MMNMLGWLILVKALPKGVLTKFAFVKDAPARDFIDFRVCKKRSFTLSNALGMGTANPRRMVQLGPIPIRGIGQASQ